MYLTMLRYDANTIAKTTYYGLHMAHPGCTLELRLSWQAALQRLSHF